MALEHARASAFSPRRAAPISAGMKAGFREKEKPVNQGGTA